MQWSSNSFGWHSVLEIIVADNRRARNTLNLISITFKSSISVYFWWFFIYYKEFLYYKLNINTIFMESNRSLNLLPPAGLLTIHLGTNYYNSFKSCIDCFHTSVLGPVIIVTVSLPDSSGRPSHRWGPCWSAAAAWGSCPCSTWPGSPSGPAPWPRWRGSASRCCSARPHTPGHRYR